MPAALRESLQTTVDRIGAKIVDTVRIDTTHFVCTDGRGPAWEKAVENNIPVVVPDWIKGCEREGRIVGVRGYYLNADPRLRQIGPGAQQQQQQSQSPQPQQARSPITSPRTEITPPTPERPTHNRSPEADGGAPPPPPPKDGEEEDSEEEENEKPEPKSQAEEQKVRTEDLKPKEKEEDSEEEDSEDDEDEKATSANAKAGEEALPTRGKPATVEDDDGGSFQNVDF
jgi:hypothetical protein